MWFVTTLLTAAATLLWWSCVAARAPAHCESLEDGLHIRAKFDGREFKQASSYAVSCELLVYYVWILLPFVLVDPHLFHTCQSTSHGSTGSRVTMYLLERAQTCQDAASRPRRVFALWRCEDLDAHVLNS